MQCPSDQPENPSNLIMLYDIFPGSPGRAALQGRVWAVSEAPVLSGAGQRSLAAQNLLPTNHRAKRHHHLHCTDSGKLSGQSQEWRRGRDQIIT